MFGPGQNMKNLNQGMVSIYLAQVLENNKIIVKVQKTGVEISFLLMTL